MNYKKVIKKLIYKITIPLYEYSAKKKKKNPLYEFWGI